MARGKVRWFSDSRGYGFIESEGQDNVYVHFSAIESDRFKTLNEGELVEFELRQSERGYEAAHVVKV
jgi:CspA family cold shock protein